LAAYGSGPWGRSTPVEPPSSVRPPTDRSEATQQRCPSMQRFKAQSWRITVVVSMLMSAALVLEAGARWAK